MADVLGNCAPVGVCGLSALNRSGLRDFNSERECVVRHSNACLLFPNACLLQSGWDEKHRPGLY